MAELFNSFFIGGFECSSHRLASGRRVDVIAATEHERFAIEDYGRLRVQGIRTARDGVRWHLIEKRAGQYDFSSVLPMIRAARDAGVQVIWDLCHYGWPEDIDIFKSDFIYRFSRFARAVAEVIKEETDEVPFYAPVNEISFWSWAGGEVCIFNPFAWHSGNRLKVQLVRAAIEAMEAIWNVDPRARFAHIDPIISVVADPDRPQQREGAALAHRSQFEAWDILGGKQWDFLGGDPKYLDIIGVNYYFNNQRIFDGPELRDRHHPLHRPLRSLLQDVYARYQRPIFIAETGIEGEARPDWLRWVAEESRAAMDNGVPLEGICLYPIVNHPGWDDDRHCENGLWDYPDETGHREAYTPLAEELTRQQAIMEEVRAQAITV